MTVKTGRHEKSATIVIFKPGTTAPLITYTLADLVVTAVRDSETGVRGDIPLEEIQFTTSSSTSRSVPYEGAG